MMEQAMERMLRERIVLNRAQCNRCEDVVVSRTHHDYRTCRCTYLAVDGGRKYLKRITSITDQPYRDFRELSILTRPYSRNGLIVHAYQPDDTAIHCTSAIGAQSVAQPGDYVVYEPEGGSTAWTREDFLAKHVPMIPLEEEL